MIFLVDGMFKSFGEGLLDPFILGERNEVPKYSVLWTFVAGFEGIVVWSGFSMLISKSYKLIQVRVIDFITR